MKITLDLPDNTTCIGLFINYKSGNNTLTSTNWLTKPEDNRTIFLDGSSGKITEREG